MIDFDDLNEFKPKLSQEQLDLVQRTLDHFLQDPDFATGEERGKTFDKLEFGQALPLEVVLRDWNTKLDQGRGGRDENGGDCYEIYQIMHEND